MTEKNGENFFCIYAVSHLHCNPYGGTKCLQQITLFQSIICILLLINIHEYAPSLPPLSTVPLRVYLDLPLVLSYYCAHA